MHNCDGIKPLSVTLLDSVPTPGRLERATENIMGLCVIADSLSVSRHKEVLSLIHQELSQRPPTPKECWGESEKRWKTARIVCERCQKHIGWPSSNFVPSDSLRIAFFSQHDMFDGVDAVMGIFEDLGIGGIGEEVDDLMESAEATMLDLVIACEQLVRGNRSELGDNNLIIQTSSKTTLNGKGNYA